MKRIIFFLLFLPTLAFSQLESREGHRFFSGKITNLVQTGTGGVGASAYWQVTGNFNDAVGLYESGDISEGDIIYFDDAGLTFFLPVDTIISTMHPSFVVRCLIGDITAISSIPTTNNASISEATPMYEFYPFIGNLTAGTQQGQQEDTWWRLDSILQILGDTVGGGGGDVLPPREIGFGTGFGETSDNDFRYSYDEQLWVKCNDASPDDNPSISARYDTLTGINFPCYEVPGYIQIINNGFLTGTLTPDSVKWGNKHIFNKRIELRDSSSLRFYELGNGNYSAFKAQNQSTNITYLLPSASSNGVLQNTGGTLSWASTSSLADNLGNHNADDTLDMDGFPIIDASTIVGRTNGSATTTQTFSTTLSGPSSIYHVNNSDGGIYSGLLLDADGVLTGLIQNSGSNQSGWYLPSETGALAKANASIELQSDVIKINNKTSDDPPRLQFFEDPDNASPNFFSLRAPTLTSNQEYVWPDNIGTNGILLNDGSGGLTWSPASGFGDNLGNHNMTGPLFVNGFPLSAPDSGAVRLRAGSTFIEGQPAGAAPVLRIMEDYDEAGNEGFGLKAGAMSSNLTFTLPTTAPSDTSVMLWLPGGSTFFATKTVYGDNLGNHLAKQNLRLGGFRLTNDASGSNDGIVISDAGEVGVAGAVEAGKELKVTGDFETSATGEFGGAVTITSGGINVTGGYTLSATNGTVVEPCGDIDGVGNTIHNISNTTGYCFDVDATGGNRTINLPSSPTDGRVLYFWREDFQNNIVTVDAGLGKLINGNQTNITLGNGTNSQFKTLRIQYKSSISTWMVID